MPKEKRLKKNDYSDTRLRISKFLENSLNCHYKNILNSHRLHWELIMEYYSIRKILRQDFKYNSDLKKYILALPFNTWITYSYVFEVLVVIFSVILFYLFFFILPLFKGRIPVYGIFFKYDIKM